MNMVRISILTLAMALSLTCSENKPIPNNGKQRLSHMTEIAPMIHKNPMSTAACGVSSRPVAICHHHHRGAAHLDGRGTPPGRLPPRIEAAIAAMREKERVRASARV